jgi:hypothetical protein
LYFNLVSVSRLLLFVAAAEVVKNPTEAAAEVPIKFLLFRLIEL